MKRKRKERRKRLTLIRDDDCDCCYGLKLYRMYRLYYSQMFEQMMGREILRGNTCCSRYDSACALLLLIFDMKTLWLLRSLLSLRREKAKETYSSIESSHRTSNLQTRPIEHSTSRAAASTPASGCPFTHLSSLLSSTQLRDQQLD